MSPTRLARLATVAAIAVASVTACSAINPITTQFQYSASDGLPVDLGEVQGHNLLLVAEGEGEPAILLGSFTNAGIEDITVTIAFATGEERELLVPAGGLVLLIPDDEDTRVTGTATAAPGLAAPMVFTAESAGAVPLQVPVMDGTLPEYRQLIDLIPSPEPSPEPSPSVSPSPDPSASPEPSPAPSE